MLTHEDIVSTFLNQLWTLLLILHDLNILDCVDPSYISFCLTWTDFHPPPPKHVLGTAYVSEWQYWRLVYHWRKPTGTSTETIWEFHSQVTERSRGSFVNPLMSPKSRFQNVFFPAFWSSSNPILNLIWKISQHLLTHQAAHLLPE